MSTITCQHCGQANPQGTVHCTKCGESLKNTPSTSPKTSKNENSYYEGKIYSSVTIGWNLQKWADWLAHIGRILFIILAVVSVILFVANIGSYLENKDYLEYLGETRYATFADMAVEALSAKNAIVTSLIFLPVSVLGAIFSPILFGWLYAFGVHLQTNQKLLETQKELLEISRNRIAE